MVVNEDAIRHLIIYNYKSAPSRPLKRFEHKRLKGEQGQMLEKSLTLSDITKILF